MKKQIKVFLLSFLGFLLLAFIIMYLQNKKFSYLMNHGRYTIAIGTELENRKVGTNMFTYEYKVNNKVYEGGNSATGNKGEMVVGGIYFVIFDPYNPKSSFLLRYPNVPAEINLDSIPKDGWSELPVPVSKDSIRNFLD